MYTTSKPVIEHIKTFHENMDQLFHSAKHSDTILVAREGSVFPIHRCILSARSAEFAQLFASNAKQDRIKVDVTYVSLKDVLRYLYSEMMSVNKKWTDEQLIVAQKVCY